LNTLVERFTADVIDPLRICANTDLTLALERGVCKSDDACDV
jgi:hypothetical protein